MSYRTKSTYKGRQMQRGVIDHSHDPQPYLFGHWRFNADSGDLFDGETTTRLEPQVSKLLRHFLDKQNQVISRDELITAVWENRIVSDDAINRCVSILRQTLSPEDKNAYIETVVRKGYIGHFPPSPLEEAPEAKPYPHRKYLLLAALISLAAVLLYTATGKIDEPFGEPREPRRAGPPLVAVLPFVSSNQADGDSEFFANGVHDDLLTQLAKLQSIRVISSTSVKEYGGTERNLRKIGAELGADVILEGSLQIAANQIRINAQLIDARTDEHLWAQTYDREFSLANIFNVQSEIANVIAEELNTTLTAQDRLQLSQIPTDNMAAYRAYHRAMEMRTADNGTIDSPEYLQALEEAVKLDPKFTRAWAQLVNALAFQNFSLDDPELARRTEQALASLQALAPGSADHLVGQAAYFYYALKDYDQAHRIISQVLTMNPGYVHALEMRAWIERRQGDFEASLDSRRELQSLDPRNPKWTEGLVFGLMTLHRYDDAWAEIATSPLNSFSLEENANLLLFRDDRDYSRLLESTEESCFLYEVPDCGWEVYIANRDYPGALDALDRSIGEIPGLGLARSVRNRILTLWLMNEYELLAERIPGWQAQLEESRKRSAFSRSPIDIDLAMLAGIRGNTGESEQLLKLWLGPEGLDWANRSTQRHEACRVLGMISATQSAIKCIRDGLEEASQVHPFWEPYLPFYDSIRDQPEFIEMLSEIDGKSTATRLY